MPGFIIISIPSQQPQHQLLLQVTAIKRRHFNKPCKRVLSRPDIKRLT